LGIFIFCFQLHFGQEDEGRVLDASNVPEIILQLKKQPTSLDQLKQLQALNFSIENYREALKYSLQLLELEETDAHRYKVARGYEKLVIKSMNYTYEGSATKKIRPNLILSNREWVPSKKVVFRRKNC
jgi:hypothetical protein